MSRYPTPIFIVASLLLSACVALPPTPVAQHPASGMGTPLPAEVKPTPSLAGTPIPVVQASPTAVAPSGAGRISVETLRNATYSGIYDFPITLKKGLYEGEPIAPNDPSRPTVTYIGGAELQGDLNGDGVNDAVVFLLERGGGSGAFTYVAAQLNRNGNPVDAGAVMIEDRIGVRSAAIENGQVVLDIITQGPGDVACCGTHKARKTYSLQGGRLMETTKDSELIRVSAADLDGTSWTLIETKEGQPASSDPQVTLSFQNGGITGSGGCNSYNSSFTLGRDNPFVMTVGPIVATRKACPEPILSQETAYFTALERVSHWGYVYGRLALYYTADDQAGLAQLLFVSQ